MNRFVATLQDDGARCLPQTECACERVGDIIAHPLMPACCKVVDRDGSWDIYLAVGEPELQKFHYYKGTRAQALDAAEALLLIAVEGRATLGPRLRAIGRLWTIYPDMFVAGVLAPPVESAVPNSLVRISVWDDAATSGPLCDAFRPGGFWGCRDPLQELVRGDESGGVLMMEGGHERR